jgi:hypothetical protein
MDLNDFGRSCSSLETFINFVERARIEAMDCSYRPIIDLIGKERLKVIMPLLKLCMRFINEVSIFTELHVIFLTASIQFNCPFEALPVVSA